MKKLISEIQNALSPSSIAPGRKLEKEPRGMTIEARSLGPATSAPNVTQHVGSVDEVVVIKAPPDDPKKEAPSIWNAAPSWLTSRDL